MLIKTRGCGHDPLKSKLHKNPHFVPLVGACGLEDMYEP